MDKDNKRGFSGLSNLTSDAGTLPQSQSCQSSPQTSVPQKPVFALLELTKWPTLPVPWSSADAGETWGWGDFFLAFQKKPKNVLDLIMEIQGEKAEYRGVTYHYAISAFYRIDRNPHGPSHRPIYWSAVGSERPAKDDRRSGVGVWASGKVVARQKEKLRMHPGDSFVYWHWWPGCLGADVHMRELGMRSVYDTEGGSAHVW